MQCCTCTAEPYALRGVTTAAIAAMSLNATLISLLSLFGAVPLRAQYGVPCTGELSAATGIPLELIEGGSHGLGSVTADGRLVQFVHRVSEQAKSS